MEPIARRGLCRYAAHKFDDNPDGRRTPANAHNCPSRVVFCLVTHCAWSWQEFTVADLDAAVDKYT